MQRIIYFFQTIAGTKELPVKAISISRLKKKVTFVNIEY